MTRNRFDNALLIQEGACNMLALTSALADAIRECDAEQADRRQDPAIRLMLHQLCHLAMISTDDYGHVAGFNYDRDYKITRERASDVTRNLLTTNAAARIASIRAAEEAADRRAAEEKFSTMLDTVIEQAGVPVVEIHL